MSLKERSHKRAPKEVDGLDSAKNNNKSTGTQGALFVGALSRSRRRFVERAIKAHIEKDGDRCSLCHAAFLHNSKTFAGLTADGVVADVGECCVAKLQHIVLAGLYVTKNYEALTPRSGDASTPSPEKIFDTINLTQKYIAEVDRITANIAKKAGIPSAGELHLAETPWKADDRKWFAEHPQRAHRLRAMFPGEFLDVKKTTYALFGADKIPDEYELLSVIRQIEPGTRQRQIFCHNINDPVPDDEHIIHALFDLLTADDVVTGTPLSRREIVALASKYAAAAQRGQS